MRGFLAILTGCVVLAVSGFVHGHWTNRWGSGNELEEAVARLDNIPLVVGEWRGQDFRLPAEETAGANLAGYRAWRYENRKGQQVTALLVCGLPGPVSVHTPDVCYSGAGYEMAGDPLPVMVSAGGPSDRAGFLAASFRKGGPLSTSGLRIYWGWNAAGTWETPGEPRWAFARYKALYKLYVLRENSPRDATDLRKDPCVDFMSVYLPEVDRALFLQPPQ
jgi:hypothetical protein